MDKIDDIINKVHCADCLEFMKNIPDKSIDLVLTDPPFNCGKDFKNDKMELNEYFKWLDKFISMLPRVMKDNTALLIECSKKYLPENLDILRKYFNYEHLIINHYTNDMRRGKMGWSKYSIILWFSKGHRKNNFCTGDLIKTVIISDKKQFRHPSPKVITCYKKIIEQFSNENDIILDCFLGSGTTALACIQLNRKYIGIEISPEYCKIAQARIDKENSQLKMELK